MTALDDLVAAGRVVPPARREMPEPLRTEGDPYALSRATDEIRGAEPADDQHFERLRRATGARHDDVVKFREIIRLLEEDGWVLVAQRGSHQQYEHPDKTGKVTVAGKPGDDVPRGTAANILRQAGLRRPRR